MPNGPPTRGDHAIVSPRHRNSCIVQAIANVCHRSHALRWDAALTMRRASSPGRGVTGPMCAWRLPVFQRPLGMEPPTGPISISRTHRPEEEFLRQAPMKPLAAQLDRNVSRSPAAMDVVFILFNGERLIADDAFDHVANRDDAD